MSQAETKTALKVEGTKGAIEIVRPAELAEKNITGLVARGIFEKVEKNKFNAARNDYFIRGEDGTLFILNDTQALKEQLMQEGVMGQLVEVHYEGKVKTKNGQGYHNFSCFIVNK